MLLNARRCVRRALLTRIRIQFASPDRSLYNSDLLRCATSEQVCSSSNGGRSSVGRVQDCDSCCRGFEPHRPPHPLDKAISCDRVDQLRSVKHSFHYRRQCRHGVYGQHRAFIGHKTCDRYPCSGYLMLLMPISSGAAASAG